MDARQLGARYGEPARLGAGGEQQPVVGQALAVGELDLADPHVERRHLGPGSQLDLPLGVEGLVVDEGLPAGLAAR